MRVDRPPPEELNTGPETAARPAASVIVLRDAVPSEGPGPAPDAGEPGIEILLVKRNPEARFMGGAWVFPGGAVHEDDGGPEWAALRELEEEAGIALSGPGRLVPYSRWITPAQVKTRFDTYFFLAEAPPGAEPRCDGQECVDIRWLRPAEALEAHVRGELLLVFPTIKHLEQLTELRSVAHALEVARAREVVPIQPRVVVRDGHGEVLLPGEPGFDD
jgi:8-oxo-dGTP pyrophosphatase MutT (NUDIX family)